ncbi:MAG: hypothetical protein WAW37_03155 [Syntrophobacteraceae bacterium]
MIRPVAALSDLPPEVIEEYRKKGWTDEEIIESFSDAVDFFNSRFWCEDVNEDISLDCIFSDVSSP